MSHRNKTASLRHYPKPGQKPWLLEIPESYIGKRIRQRFSTEAEGKTALEYHTARARKGAKLPISTPEALLLARYRGRLSLTEMGRALDGALATKEKLITPLRKVAYLYLDHVDRRHRAGSVSDLHARDVERIIPIIMDHDVGDTPLDKLAKSDIQKWIDSLPLGEKSKRNYLAHFRTILTYAVAEGYLSVPPATDVIIPPEPRTIPIITPDEMRFLLAAAKRLRCNPTYWWLIFGGFAGLRTSEIERLDWSDIRPEHDGELYVRPGKTKNSERWVAFTDPLHSIDWHLMPKSGNVLMDTPKRKRQDLVAKVYALAKTSVPTNALRHSFASYHLCWHKEPSITAVQLGHHSPTQTFAAYRRAVTWKDSKEWFRLVPPMLPFPRFK